MMIKNSAISPPTYFSSVKFPTRFFYRSVLKTCIPLLAVSLLLAMVFSIFQINVLAQNTSHLKALRDKLVKMTAERQTFRAQADLRGGSPDIKKLLSEMKFEKVQKISFIVEKESQMAGR